MDSRLGALSACLRRNDGEEVCEWQRGGAGVEIRGLVD